MLYTFCCVNAYLMFSYIWGLRVDISSYWHVSLTIIHALFKIAYHIQCHGEQKLWTGRLARLSQGDASPQNTICSWLNRKLIWKEVQLLCSTWTCWARFVFYLIFKQTKLESWQTLICCHCGYIVQLVFKIIVLLFMHWNYDCISRIFFSWIVLYIKELNTI